MLPYRVMTIVLDNLGTTLHAHWQRLRAHAFRQTMRESPHRRHEMRKHSSRFLLAASSLFLVFTLLLAACGETAPGPSSSKQSSTFATQADAFLSQEATNRAFSGVVLVT